jgi:predicted RNase H-like HicB family nuclease
MEHNTGEQEALGLEVDIEVAPNGACMAHVPSLPGFNFRADSTSELAARGRGALREYTDWLNTHGLAGLTTTTRPVAERVAAHGMSAVRLRPREQIAGAPVWESGNAAALFFVDHRALCDQEVQAHLRFLRDALAWIRTIVTPLTAGQRAWAPAPGRRTIDETLDHIGNCIWWYTSRLDDGLPEPPQVDSEDPLDRMDRAFALSAEFLSRVTLADRTRVYVPTRYPTCDCTEVWTHTKVCRREAEHVWAHRSGLLRDTRAAAVR